MERSRSMFTSFSGCNITVLTAEMNEFTKDCSKINSYIVVEEQTIINVGTKYKIVLRYHIENPR